MTDVTVQSEGGATRAGDVPDQWGLATAADYFALLKPRVMSLVIFTGFVGMIVAPTQIHPAIGFAAILCLAVGAGAAGALNMWYEADLDAVMKRTAIRPLPMGRVARDEALTLGVALSIGSVVSMTFLVNLLAGILLAATILFYALVYTVWLKPRTAQNIVIGGAAGAFPPVIGWTAATGTLELAPWALFLIIFLWTPPHFWALALCRTKEYRAAGLPMMPVVAGSDSTRRQIVVYSVLLVAASLLPVWMGMASLFYAGVAVILGAVFVVLSVDLLRKGAIGDDLERVNDPLASSAVRAANKSAMLLFKFSLTYLFVLFASLLVGGI